MQLRAVGPWLWLERRDIMTPGSMPFQARLLRGESYLEATLRSIVAPRLGLCISGRRLDCAIILLKLLERVEPSDLRIRLCGRAADLWQCVLVFVSACTLRCVRLSMSTAADAGGLIDSTRMAYRALKIARHLRMEVKKTRLKASACEVQAVELCSAATVKLDKLHTLLGRDVPSRSVLVRPERA